VKKRRSSVEQITSLLQQVAGGIAVGEVCRQVGTRASKAIFGKRSRTFSRACAPFPYARDFLGPLSRQMRRPRTAAAAAPLRMAAPQ